MAAVLMVNVSWEGVSVPQGMVGMIAVKVRTKHHYFTKKMGLILMALFSKLLSIVNLILISIKVWDGFVA